MGYDSEWTFEGRLNSLPVPDPVKKRPRLGCRYTVMCQLGKLIHPIRRELKDSVHEESRLKSAKLLELMMIYVEDNIVEHLNYIVPVMLNIYTEEQQGASELKSKIDSCFRLMGRYCSSASFHPIFEKHLFSEVA